MAPDGYRILPNQGAFSVWLADRCLASRFKSQRAAIRWAEKHARKAG